MKQPSFSLSGLRPRLMLLIVAAIAPLLGLSFYWASQERQAEEERIHESSDRLVGILAAELEGALAGARDILVALSHSQQFVSGGRDACEALLSSLPQHYPRLRHFGLAGLDGDVICRSVQFEGQVNVSDRAYFRLALQDLDFAVGDFQIGRAIRKPGLGFGYPLFGNDGRVKAVLFSTLDLEWLDRIAGGLHLPPGAEAIVVDRHGTVLDRYPDHDKWVGRLIPGSEVVGKSSSQVDANWDAIGVDGIARSYSSARIDQRGEPAIYIAVGLSEAVEYAKVDRRLRARLLAIALVLLLALGAAWFLSTKFVLGPIDALLRVTGRLADGDLAARAGLPQGDGELDRLAAHLDRMAGLLEQREAERRAVGEELEERVVERTSMLQEANEELDAFAYSVSHDLRAPLRAMQGFAQALLEDYVDRLDDTAKGYASRIVKASERMDALIQGLLEYSRLGRREIRLQPVSLESVVTEALSHLEADLCRSNAEVTVAEAMPQVMGDHTVLVQIVMNLLSNAAKFVAPGVRPQVSVGAALPECTDSGDGEEVVAQGAVHPPQKVRLWIEDNGIGVAPQYRERIFRVFERLHGEEAYAGTGIGLALVRKATERMGGRIGVESVVGQGSRFWVELSKA